MKAIMYHYVRPAPEQLPHFRYLHAADFSEQLDWFADQGGFVTREEFFVALETGRAPQGFLLTFDDGLSDHHEHVLPLLVERGLFGFFYICTAPYKTGRLLDVHRIHLYLGRVGGRAALERLSRVLDDTMLGDAHIQEFREGTYKRQENDSATTLFKRTLNYLISYQHREAVLDKLFAEEFGDERDLARRFYLTHEQIREMDAFGMVVGSHGQNHFVFSKLSVDDQRSEITASFSELSSVLGRPVSTFCYPYGGRHTFTSDTVAILNEVGSAFSFDVDPRDITGKDLRDHRQALPRYDCNMFPYGKASMGPKKATYAPDEGSRGAYDAAV